MADLSLPRIEIDGHPATVESLWFAMSGDYGHFTAMQVRDRKVRGMDLHLARLDEGTRALFGADLDGDRIREHVRHALRGDIRDASVRVHIFGSGRGEDLSVMVTVRDPAAMPSIPQSLQTVPYQRTLPHVKHMGGFGQAYYGQVVKENGFDEALLVGPDGAIAEGSITNIGFAEGDTIVWPDAPALRGITMQVLERELTNAGSPWSRRPVYLGDVASFDGAFITNARGIAPVGRIDDIVLPTGAAVVSSVVAMFDAAPWEPI